MEQIIVKTQHKTMIDGFDEILKRAGYKEESLIEEKLSDGSNQFMKTYSHEPMLDEPSVEEASTDPQPSLFDKELDANS